MAQCTLGEFDIKLRPLCRQLVRHRIVNGDIDVDVCLELWSCAEPLFELRSRDQSCCTLLDPGAGLYLEPFWVVDARFDVVRHQDAPDLVEGRVTSRERCGKIKLRSSYRTPSAHREMVASIIASDASISGGSGIMRGTAYRY
jgi:hypothetical protein